MSTQALPQGLTQHDLYQLVLNRPVMVNDAFGLNIDTSGFLKEDPSRISELFINAVLMKLNDLYGCDFECPYDARSMSDSDDKIFPAAEKTELFSQENYFR